ncbi:MAG: S-layer glycoprotein N-glycosyltransferase AglJ [Halobacteriales archaeon]|nr:S-layer glycoprotein N-glycosyltransferase AglJ [Halobacteriales archaeon]
MDSAEVCVLLPAMNEAETVGAVVADFRDVGFDEILVVDGGSEDDTRARARAAGARVVEQRGHGKGQAIRQAVNEEIRRPVVLMADADGTYDPADAEQMLDPIQAGRADHVIGNRFANLEPDAMTRLNRLGNRLANRVFSVIHGERLGDILSGYRAFTRQSFQRYTLSADGFGIETELSVEAVKHGTTVEVVPITYRTRPAGSETNLHPIADGARIFATLYRLAKTSNPLFYFGSVGSVSLLAGLVIASYVGVEWFLRTPPVSHEALTVVGAAAVILGVQLLVFGVLSDVIITANREQTRRMEQLVKRLAEEQDDNTERDSDPSPKRKTAGSDE